jgi:hypothetical protein
LDAFSTFSLRLTAAQELGFTHTALFLFYQLGKRARLWQLLTPARDWDAYPGELTTREIIPWAVPPAANGTLSPAPPAAEEILRGRVTLFGALPVPLTFTVPGPLRHWTHHETPQINGQDIKFIWEPARLGWVFPLAHAYQSTGDERYPAAFWECFEQFCTANPPNLGPHWASAQEVGLRLIAFVYAHRVFAPSPHTTPERLTQLGRAVAAHAARLPPTLLYARAQNNNHLLSEAAALYTAGLTLPAHPHAPRWRKLGWKWFHHGLQTQIEPDGTYTQHSTNYHRLMLQLALWVAALAHHDPFVVGALAPKGTEVPTTNPFPPKSLTRLASATRWLLALCDPETGRVPNLGPNDGAYLFPHPTLPFHDYRPVLQAASQAFLGTSAFSSSTWDATYFPPPPLFSSAPLPPPSPPTPHLSLITHHSRAYLRAAHFPRRPGHADQLHLDLWWRGLNIALDPGTYLYNAAPPWDNTLTTAFVHNTLTVNGLDQMTRAGRFLYVNRAQATTLEHTPTRLTAEHDGYRALGLLHRRTIELAPTGWRIADTLVKGEGFRGPLHPSPFNFRLHWLLPDWPWKLEANTLQIQSPHGWFTLRMETADGPPLEIHLFRAGETLIGPVPAPPTWGWYSPTYGVKTPALAFVGVGKQMGPMITEWTFPEA